MQKLSRKLTSNARKHIAESNFALPGRRYPIHDISHARAALSMVAKHGTPAEQAQVRAAVHSKYPSLGAKHAMLKEAYEKVAMVFGK